MHSARSWAALQITPGLSYGVYYPPHPSTYGKRPNLHSKSSFNSPRWTAGFLFLQTRPFTLSSPSLFRQVYAPLLTGLVLCEWMPPADRAKASKGKRGWEKQPTPLSPSGASFSSPTSQGWVIRQLLRSLLEQTAASQAVAPSLEALAALCQDNPTGCALLRADLPSNSAEVSPTGSLQPFLLQLRSPSPEVRIATTQL